MKFVDALGNIKYGKAMFFGNNIQMSEQADGIVTINAAVLSGTGSKLSLLGDVLVSSVQDDQFVRWNAGSSLWINQFITAADVGAGTFKVGTYTFPSNTILSGTVNIYGKTTLNNNLIVSGTTTLVGASTQRVGTSSTFGRWPTMLFESTTIPGYSGTSEISFLSFTLTGNSFLSGHNQTLTLTAIFNAQTSPLAYNIKFGNIIIASGFVANSRTEKIDITLWNPNSSNSNLRSFVVQTSGVGVQTQSFSPSIDLTQDQLIDIRGNNQFLTSFESQLRYVKAMFDSD